MLKFVKHHMESILGIEIYPMISLLIFFIFFVVVSIYVFGLTKKDVEDMGNIPLNDGLPEKE
ncbi:CcoQ/FixQ family Cbb3-type cytochrome c oxidase assembly chaperone [Flexithrix dorotheae]|uniref:CcoQ/FixQ family Cbb3-type cytochrome c oxidase assembly chaperone n=1 Tax=Flexithrix dorotheae TaxID=70993 RepID=UPI0003629D79|nr:CcoQ/FixQ family Cbb3-type cytochrome c oxidase assembly chaperone [Flexithrix dorotheae]